VFSAERFKVRVHPSCVTSWINPNRVNPSDGEIYARRMGQPTQRATNYIARSNIDTAQIFLHANGQRPKRAMIRQRSRRRQRRGEPHTEHGLGVLLAFTRASSTDSTRSTLSHSHSGIDEKRPTEKFVVLETRPAHIHERVLTIAFFSNPRLKVPRSY